MRLIAQSLPLHEVEADWLIVGAWEKEAFSGKVADLDTKLGGLLSRLRERGDIAGKPYELGGPSLLASNFGLRDSMVEILSKA